MNTVEIMKRVIEECNIKEFTHHEIIKWTNTNCPYTVLRQLKKYYEIDYEDITKTSKIIDLKGIEIKETKRFRKYKVIKRKKKCQKT